MVMEPIGETNQHRSLRLWPGVVIVLAQWTARFGVPLIVPDAAALAAIGALLGGLALVVWWAFFSRAPRSERWGAIVVMAVALVGTQQLLHESIATGGMGVLFFLYAVPVLSLAFVAWALASRHLAATPRRIAMVATIVLACGVWILFRTGGITGDSDSDFHWRWTMTPEQRLLALDNDEPRGLPSAADAVASAADWPGFRGASRDSVIGGVRLETDWSASPPIELWRRPIGPGWSSFAVGAGRIYTQEQRGDDEVVSSYDLSTGEPVWRHSDAARFWESNGGAGPRGTPTLRDGHVYTLGATGIVNVLDAGNGAVVWSRNAGVDAGREVPFWGFASSPVVLDDIVIVAAAGTLVAYDRATGQPRWFGRDGGAGYSSPHRLTIGGVAQIVLQSGHGAAGFAPADGALLWEHPWSGAPIVQPAITADGDLLISTVGVSGPLGTRRIAITSGESGWTTQERWSSIRLKPNFNDFVVHEGHAFGFDGSILACIDVENGERQWKGGRYGYGQLVLLPDQDLLLVISEDGELVLVNATPDRFTELARFPALDGKTWNHPVLVDDLLLVRNGQEMVAFRLSLAGA